MRLVRRNDHDPLTALADLPDVTPAIESARRAIDAVLWDRHVRSASAEVAERSRMQGASASAALDGADLAVVEDSPMGRTLLAAQVVTEQAARQSDTWERAPLQVIAALHAVIVRGLAVPDEPGRPRSIGGEHAGADPLRLGALPPPETVAPRLQGLARVISGSATVPGLLVAAVVHGELMTLRPFGVGNGLLARAVVRCVLVSRGVDPSMFTIPEEGMLAAGRPAYARALQDFATGTPDRMARALIAFASWCESGAMIVRAG